MADVFIRSYNNYSHEFVTSTGNVVVPSKWVKPNNIAKVTDVQYAELLKDDIFSVLIGTKNGGYKKLDKMPQDALSAMEKLSDAQNSAAKSKADAEAYKIAADKAHQEIERLKNQLEAEGGVDEVLDAAKEAADAKAELDELKAELAELRAKKEAPVVAPVPDPVIAEPVVTSEHVTDPAPTTEANA